MKRLMTLSIGFVTVALLVTSSAWMQSQSQTASEIRSQLGLRENPRAGYISKSARHKLIIDQSDQQNGAYAELKNSGSLVEEFDYGSFKMAVVDEYAAGGLERLLQMQMTIRDDMNLIDLGGHEIDTTAPGATLDQLPVELRQNDVADAMAKGTQPKGGFYIVQFIGPIQVAWFAALEGTGAEVVSYLSANAYVVSADRRAAAKLIGLKHKKSFVQFLGDYEPAYRLSAYLQNARRMSDRTVIDVSVEVFDSAKAESSLSELQAIADEFVSSYEVLNRRVFDLRVASSRLDEIARMDAVFAVRETSNSPLSAEAGAQKRKKEIDSVYADFLNKRQQPSPAMRRIERLISGPDRTERFALDQTQALNATGETYRVSGRILDSSKPTRIALAWTSPPGITSAMVNDLDLELYVNGAVYKGNVFAEGVSVKGGRADNINPVEAIILPAGVDGEFILTVRAANLAGDGVPDKAGRTDQDFALAGDNLSLCQTVWMNPNQFNLTRFEGVESTTLESFIVRSAFAHTERVPFTAAPPNFPVGIVSIVSCASCITPDTVKFRSPAFVGFPVGTYLANIEIVASGCLHWVPVHLTIVPPSVTLSPTSLSFTAQAGGPNPANKSFTISAGTNSIPWNVSSNASWLTASPTSGTAAPSSTVSVSVNVAGLAVGTHTGVITVSLPNGNVLRTLPVLLTVSTPQIGVNPTSLTFSTQPGGANPPAQTISITNTGVGTLNWTASDNRTWLSVNPASGTAPSTLTVSINKAGLAVGTHTGTVTITAPGASNSPRSIPITLVISNTPPIITVSPTSLTFAARQGITPPPKTVSITNTGGGALNWSASSNASWLLVSPASGTAPSTLTVSINPSGLGVGTYQGTITLTAPGASPVTISVTFGVIEPLP